MDGPLLLRSTDSGRTWHDLTAASGLCAFVWEVTDVFRFLTQPVLVTRDGHTLFADQSYDETPTGEGFTISGSLGTGGNTWTDLDQHMTGAPTDYGAGVVYLALSSLSRHRDGPQRLYALYRDFDGYSPELYDMFYSDDDGLTWHDLGYSLVYGNRMPPCCSSTVLEPYEPPIPDPDHLLTVYVNLSLGEGFRGPKPLPSLVARTRDAGLHWTLLPLPRAQPPLRTFSVTTDRHEGGLLVGRTWDRSVPADRIYLSADQGQTWRPARCPGDLHGTCPVGTVENVFGAGASYAFVGNGIYRFQGGGPALARLAVSDRLPVPTARIRAVAGGDHAGDPVYLLTRGTVLYRSLDGGHSWQRSF